MTVVNTPFTITDVQGNPLCHTWNAHKRNLDATRKARVRAQAWAMVSAAGLYHTGTGLGVCAMTGDTISTTVPRVAGNMAAVADLGHVIADEHNGPMCACNLISISRMINLNNGTNTMTDIAFDPRGAWHDLWLSAYASKAKARLAVEAMAGV